MPKLPAFITFFSHGWASEVWFIPTTLCTDFLCIDVLLFVLGSLWVFTILERIYLLWPLSLWSFIFPCSSYFKVGYSSLFIPLFTSFLWASTSCFVVAHFKKSLSGQLFSNAFAWRFSSLHVNIDQAIQNHFIIISMKVTFFCESSKFKFVLCDRLTRLSDGFQTRVQRTSLVFLARGGVHKGQSRSLCEELEKWNKNVTETK